MQNELKYRIKSEIQEFRETVNKFFDKEISVKDFKGISGGFGCYAQRGGNAMMLRLRMTAGVLTKEKMHFVARSMEEYKVKRAHFTTCSTIQFHDLSADETLIIMDQALEHDIVCRGGGGDFPRNVIASPLSGVEKGEAFDIMPYAMAAGDYMITLVSDIKLPRKLKVAFSNSAKDSVHASFRDLGFMANEDHTFDVYCCGGLGNNPKMGVKVAENIDPKDVLIYIDAMIGLFKEHGNYENRAKARTRYIQESLGVEKLQSEFDRYVKLAAAKPELKFEVKETAITKKGTEKLVDPRAIEQKQEGLYAVYYHPIGGDIDIERFIKLEQLIADMPEVECRITSNEGMFVINLNAEEASKVLALTDDSAKNEFETSIACIGASICQVGLRDSQEMLHELVEAMRKENFKDHVLPKIHISGCPSSCGTHQIGSIGFQGSVKVIDKQPHQAFVLYVYGKENLEERRLGQSVGTILKRDMIPFFTELGKLIQADDSTFEAWTEAHPDEFMELCKKYTN